VCGARTAAPHTARRTPSSSSSPIGRPRVGRSVGRSVSFPSRARRRRGRRTAGPPVRRSRARSRRHLARHRARVDARRLGEVPRATRTRARRRRASDARRRAVARVVAVAVARGVAVGDRPRVVRPTARISRKNPPTEGRDSIETPSG